MNHITYDEKPLGIELFPSQNLNDDVVESVVNFVYYTCYPILFLLVFWEQWFSTLPDRGKKPLPSFVYYTYCPIILLTLVWMQRLLTFLRKKKKELPDSARLDRIGKLFARYYAIFGMSQNAVMPTLSGL